MSYADKLFKENVRDILENGVWDTGMKVRATWDDGTPAHTIHKFGIINRYDLQKEFPMITLRKQNWRGAIDEALWIYQKKSSDIHDLHSHVWDKWANEHGSVGKTYGYQMGVKHQYEDGMFDQIDRVLKDLKEFPASRRMLTSSYVHADLHEMAMAPCVWSCTFDVSNGRLNMILNQRSQDMMTANGWDVTAHAALLMMMAQVSDLEPGELVHVIANAHIYDRHVDAIKKVIEKPEFPAPTVTLDPTIKDYYQFTVDSFHVENYQANPNEGKIEVSY